MAKLCYNDDVLDLVCECGESVSNMKLVMTYQYPLQNYDFTPYQQMYCLEDKDYDITSVLTCSCGITYREDVDFTVRWDNDGWDMVVKRPKRSEDAT